MAYVTEITQLLTKTLERFVTLKSHQLAGHCANLEFWIGEVEHCLQVIDGYKKRFETMTAGEAAYVNEHGIIEAHPVDPYLAVGPTPTRKVPDHQRKQARLELTESCYRFLIRLFNSGLIDRLTLDRATTRLGLGVEENDLKR